MSILKSFNNNLNKSSLFLATIVGVGYFTNTQSAEAQIANSRTNMITAVDTNKTNNLENNNQEPRERSNKMITDLMFHTDATMASIRFELNNIEDGNNVDMERINKMITDLMFHTDTTMERICFELKNIKNGNNIDMDVLKAELELQITQFQDYMTTQYAVISDKKNSIQNNPMGEKEKINEIELEGILAQIKINKDYFDAMVAAYHHWEYSIDEMIHSINELKSKTDSLAAKANNF